MPGLLHSVAGAEPRAEPRVMLVLARPGRELFVHGWMEHLRPLVLVLTDGSDGRGHSSLDSTAAVIQATRSRIGSMFGRFTESGLRRALVLGDPCRFACLAEEIADLLVLEEIEWVITELGEFQSPGGDVSRILIDAAAGLVSRRRLILRNYGFSVRDPHGSDRHRSRQIELQLDDRRWERKRRAMLATSGMAHVLQRPSSEIERWKREVLVLAEPWKLLRAGTDLPLEYPLSLEAAGIRPGEHLLPLAESLRLLAASGRVAA